MSPPSNSGQGTRRWDGVAFIQLVGLRERTAEHSIVRYCSLEAPASVQRESSRKTAGQQGDVAQLSEHLLCKQPRLCAAPCTVPHVVSERHGRKQALMSANI